MRSNTFTQIPTLYITDDTRVVVKWTTATYSLQLL